MSLHSLLARVLRRPPPRVAPRLGPAGCSLPPLDPAVATPAQQEFERLGPWMSRFVIDGLPLGGVYDYATDVRPGQLEARLGSLAGKRILELGALEGGHTLRLARAGARVVAIEGQPANYERCLFVKRHFGLAAADFVLADLRVVDFTPLGPFDAILNSGILYHLDAPWDLLLRLGRAADRMFLWTHCAHPGRRLRTVRVGGTRIRGRWHREWAHPLSGVQPWSFWPVPESLERMLEVTGWTSVTWLGLDLDAEAGPAASIWAQRPAGPTSGGQ